MKAMTKRPKQLKRVREKRVRAPLRCSRAFSFDAKLDPDAPYKIRVYLSPTRTQMHQTILFIRGHRERKCLGMMCSFTKHIGGKQKSHAGYLGNMFLNVADLRADSANIISHESAHAGMAYARLRNADLSDIDGEEVLCYAVGRMTNQVNRMCFAFGVWR